MLGPHCVLKQRHECIELMKNNILPDEDESDTLIPDLVANPRTAFTIETSNATMSRDEALCLLRSLNTKQSAIFYKVRKWCLQKLLGENPEPFRLFVTGGAGTGKSHLIKAIYYESSRLLSKLSEKLDDRSVIFFFLCASTGVAAFNIGAATIHNTFSIGANVKLPYQPLSDDKINSLRSKMGCLQILIMDEVSMVDHHFLSYVHGRLRQIKQTGDYSLFGKVSLIAVGDFYQLPPVKGTPLYADTKGVNLWDNNFEIAELTQVVRQQDVSFAETLNRLRVRKKNEPLSSSDINMLKQRETGEECSDVHIFPTNEEVDKYNIQRLNEVCPDAISIQAQDFVRNPKTGRIEEKAGFHTRVFNSCLDKCVSLGVGARVMLKKNIDVSDGLVNGAFGTVVHISRSQKQPDEDDDFPSAIHVEFDDPNVGKIQRSKQRHTFSQNSTVIEVQEDQVTNDGGLRRQFPLRLAWACNVHKVQGLTVDKAVVSLEKIFTSGQAYVALSRVRTLNGLIIQNFKESAIYCNDKIELAMKCMPKFPLENYSFTKTPGIFTIALHNVQSLQAHVQDIQAHRQLMNADCICLTETWLKVEDEVQIPGFIFKHNPRARCYDNSTPLFTHLKQQRGGGVALYSCENLLSQVVIPEPCNL
ncbi:ATP-dependent DNA helicase PIF1-like isoform X1 [Megalobrama amblycephala]|uniref:ATP-dependent DNA helicase PIF1-like isoform X1 n=1 Tax=Megalobrama amblycephala TaxID=75352 RepID=UPI0020140DB4|nr:ATP-dependent DNA helicase PIF1-like isoform X1 [Megalobrama amblycephala]